MKNNKDKALDILIEEIKGLRKELTRSDKKRDKYFLALKQQLSAVLRALYSDKLNNIALSSEMLELTRRRFQLSSQNEEDGIVLGILSVIGITDRRFIDIGCGSTGGNSGFLAKECGWKGLMVDMSDDNIETIKTCFSGYNIVADKCFVTRENINEIISKYGFVGELDLLSIDIDGNDYWVWEAINICSPRVVIIEYNWRFGCERSVTVPYDKNFNWRELGLKGYHGVSLAALEKLGLRKGYSLVLCDPAGTNAFFLRDDVGKSIPRIAAKEAFRSQYRKYTEAEPKEKDIFNEIKRSGLSLYEIV